VEQQQAGGQERKDEQKGGGGIPKPTSRNKDTGKSEQSQGGSGDSKRRSERAIEHGIRSKERRAREIRKEPGSEKKISNRVTPSKDNSTRPAGRSRHKNRRKSKWAMYRGGSEDGRGKGKIIRRSPPASRCVLPQERCFYKGGEVKEGIKNARYVDGTITPRKMRPRAKVERPAHPKKSQGQPSANQAAVQYVVPLARPCS
jgi:hypothetical protein